jgi:polyisoprenyl-phosphate glycosyltransferase
MNNIYISGVIPVYGCYDCLNALYDRLIKAFKEINESYEIIFINDGSPDNSWEAIIELCQKDKKVTGINLSRNFGQHYAITAGLDQCKGEWIVVMDCDLQDRPEEIPKLLSKAKEGYDVVFAQRIKRRDNIFKRITSKMFHGTLSYLTNTEIDASIATFGVFHRKVIDAVCLMREQLRWFPTFVNWVGFRYTKMPVEHSRRISGRSSYSIKRLIELAVNVLVLNSNKPLKLVLMFGFIVSFGSFIYAVVTLVRYLRGEIGVLGWASQIVSLWFLAGVIIFVMGIVGLYIGKIFDQIKERPLYIIRERIN